MKIDTIMSNLRDNTNINTQDEFLEHIPLTNLTLTKFQPGTIEHVEKLLSIAANKMCQLDPIPTNIVKTISGSISPLLRDIINPSLTSATFTSDLKQALLKPLLKKADLPLISKNYRPVSNLSFVSKLIEHVVCDQLSTQVELVMLKHCNQHIKKITQQKQQFSRLRQIYYNCLTRKKLLLYNVLLPIKCYIINSTTECHSRSCE